MKMRRAILLGVGVCAGMALIASANWPRLGGNSSGVERNDGKLPLAQTNATQVSAAMRNLPFYFIENRGQLDARVAYYVQGRDTALFFSSEGVTFGLTGQAAPDSSPRAPSNEASVWRAAFGAEETPSGRHRWIVKLDFVGARNGVPTGQKLSRALVSYFKGPQDQWKVGLRTFAEVVYLDLWPGIDLVYAGNGNRLKYTFFVKPGADPDQIRLAYRGATVRLNELGQIEVSTPVGGFSEDKPYAYQDIDGQRVKVDSAYLLDAPATAHAYRFRLGAYDKTKPLVLDPVILVYAGYIGGAGEDEQGNGIAVDRDGNAYVTGGTNSTKDSFPVQVGPDLTDNGNFDAFVAKVDADGTGLVYAGYIGGDEHDVGLGIAVDREGSAYVTGSTRSTQVTFPVERGPDLTDNGNFDAFVAKVDADGTGLVYAGYIGGSFRDDGLGIAVDGDGNAYVTGVTESTETTFPVNKGPDLTYNGGFADAFVVKVDAEGKKLLYAGYIGGAGFEVGKGIAVDREGSAYVTGHTGSNEASFPVKVGPDLTHNGMFNADAFVAKVDANGKGLVYAGYIGGNLQDQGFGIAVDGNGDAYVTGWTTSTQATFPAKVGPDLTFNSVFDNADAFVAKVRADGTGLVYAGYIGGAGSEVGHGIAVDRDGAAYVTGITHSDEASFPVRVGPDLTFNSVFGGGFDAFVAKVNFLGEGLVYAGYIGGSFDDRANGIAVDRFGNAYVTGFTSSRETASFPVTVGPDLTHNGGGVTGKDAFVAKISEVP